MFNNNCPDIIYHKIIIKFLFQSWRNFINKWHRYLDNKQSFEYLIDCLINRVSCLNSIKCVFFASCSKLHGIWSVKGNPVCALLITMLDALSIRGTSSCQLVEMVALALGKLWSRNQRVAKKRTFKGLFCQASRPWQHRMVVSQVISNVLDLLHPPACFQSSPSPRYGAPNLSSVVPLKGSKIRVLRSPRAR